MKIPRLFLDILMKNDNIYVSKVTIIETNPDCFYCSIQPCKSIGCNPLFQFRNKRSLKNKK